MFDQSPRVLLCALILLMASPTNVYSQNRKPIQPVSSPSNTNLRQLVSLIRKKAKVLEGSAGMRFGFRSFMSAHKLPPESISYSDYVIVRLLFEATRDAGFWNLHWPITAQPPNSDKICPHWRNVQISSVLPP